MLVFGHTIEELELVASTNDYLLDKSRKQRLFEGEVVFTHFQTKGRGQRENSWEALPGQNLLFSVFTLPTFLLGDNFFLLSKVVALALKEVVEEICINDNVEIKWPNDIYVNKKKIGGILIENQFKGNLIKQAVIGIGLNVNQTAFETNNAISLKLLTSKQFEIKKVLELVLQRLEYFYLSLKWGKNKEIESLYLEGLMNLNIEANYLVDSSSVKGIIKQVKNNGVLEIEINKETKCFQFKEIRFLI